METRNNAEKRKTKRFARGFMTNESLKEHIGLEFQSKKKPLFFLGVLVLLLVFLFLWGFFPRLSHWKELENASQFSSQLNVNTMILKRSDKPIDLILPSTTQALRITPIWSRVDGYIKNFFVDIGDNVDEGQLMLEIDTPELEQHLLQAKADLSTSLAKLSIAKISAERWKELFEINSEAVSPQEVDEKIAAHQSVLAEVESAYANAQRLEKVHEFRKLLAPFEGVVIERNIDIGSLVTAGSQSNYQQLFQIAKINVIRVFVDVPQAYFRLIKVGDEVDLIIREFPEKIFKGIIARTSRALDPQSRTLLTEIHVDNKDRKLITGLYAEVHFNLNPDSPYFIIPTTALIIRDSSPQVAVVDDKGTVKLHNVKIGRDFGKMMEITSGLNEHDKIITNPTDRVHNGTNILE